MMDGALVNLGKLAAQFAAKSRYLSDEYWMISLRSLITTGYDKVSSLRKYHSAND
jgi:hypothetical protein